MVRILFFHARFSKYLRKNWKIYWKSCLYFLEKITSAYLYFIFCSLNFLRTFLKMSLHHKYVSAGHDYYGISSVNEYLYIYIFFFNIYIFEKNSPRVRSVKLIHNRIHAERIKLTSLLTRLKSHFIALGTASRKSPLSKNLLERAWKRAGIKRDVRIERALRHWWKTPCAIGVIAHARSSMIDRARSDTHASWLAV